MEGEVAALELLMKVPGQGDSRSPFEEALERVAKGSAVDLACPYLSVDVLARLLGAGGRFRLVTDAEEWLRAFARPGRAGIIDFIRAHHGSVRHYRDLHAKVALSPTLAMLGSANFTERGLFERQEVGVLLSDRAQVRELRRWFDEVWTAAVPIDVALLGAYADSLPNGGAQQGSGKRKLPAPNLPPSNEGQGSGELSFTEEEDRLIDRLGTGISEQWVHHYLDAIARLLRALDLRPDDPRVLTPIPRSSSALTLTFNTRGVLYRGGFISHDRDSVGAAIVQTDLSVVERSPIRMKVVGTLAYDKQRGEKGTPPIIVEFADFSFLDEPTVFENWALACRQELARRDRVLRPDWHCPTVVRAALDPAYRRHLLAELQWPDD